MHPSLRILSLILLAVLVQCVTGLMLAIPAGLLAGLGFYLFPRSFRNMLFRSRWLLLAMLLIYAFTTPGEYLASWDFDLAPTYEGIGQGLQQSGRLIAILAGLALLLGSTPRGELMAGIYPLMQPLRLLRLSPERFTARLWLTMHYIEEEAVHDKTTLWSRLDGLRFAAEADPATDNVRLDLPQLRWQDWIFLMLLATCAGWWLA